MKLPVWASISIWICLGISMIMFNKMLLTTWGFRYPFFLTTWHCVLATVLTQVMAKTTTLLPGVEKGVVTTRDFILRIVPMSCCFALGLVLGNMAYRYISLAYIQMIKAFTPVPLLLLNFAVGREKPSSVQMGIVLVVSFGVILSSYGELNFSMIGFVVQLAAVLSDCCRVMMLDLMLRDLRLDSLSLLYYTAPTSAVLIFCGFMLFEASSFSIAVLNPTLCGALLLNGLLAFSLNVAVIYLVGSTSSMVLSISGPLKDILIVFISVAVFSSPVSLLQVVGFSVSLFGLYLYKEYKSDALRLQRGCAAALHCGGLGGLCFAVDLDAETGAAAGDLLGVAAALSPSTADDEYEASGDGDLELQPFLEQDEGSNNKTSAISTSSSGSPSHTDRRV